MPNQVRSNINYPSIANSDLLHSRAEGLMPAFSQTLAKGPTQYVKGVAPKYLQRGKGARVWDVDGNEFIDYNMGIGPIILGYAYDKVDEAIKEQLSDGISFSLTHPLEVEVSELIREVIPGADSVRFSKTGADVTSAAVRLARAFTGREKVLCCGYHGWHDWYIGTTPRDMGVPHHAKDLIGKFIYNDIDSIIPLMDSDVACVIMEPMIFEYPNADFLQRVKQLCEENGTLLIFDEMWTGFRLATGGAQAYFEVTADLACFSKAIANGMPLSVLCGRQDVMELLSDDVFFFTTFGGEALSLAAAKATIHELREKDVPLTIAAQGDRLIKGVNEIVLELELDPYIQCFGAPSRSIVTFDPSAGDPLLLKSLLQQELIRCGILWSGFHNLSYSHSEEDINYTLDVYREVLPFIKKAILEGSVEESLIGEPVQAVFRKTVEVK
ncbi:MAG: aminotransferase class III-fold pyridoxal phosphate-dependent enzyme [Calditrichota bacterium]